jgi:hypothetical protein
MELAFLSTEVRLLEQSDKAGYESADVRGEAGRGEEEPEQDAHGRVQDTQPGIPAQDEHRHRQHGQD